MSDECDRADMINTVLNRVAMHNQRRRVDEMARVVAIGECLFCEAPLQPGLRWCGKECRDDWERIK